MPRPISEQIQGTYFRLRFTVAIIGLAFPVLLWIGGTIAGFHLRSSMSAYYWATKAAPCPCQIDGSNPKGDACEKEIPASDNYKACLGRSPVQIPGTMRSYFVGFLFAVGAMLFANKGYSRKEDVALNIAGVTAVLIAIFPMPWTGPHDKLYWMHGVSAITFFVSIAFVSAICSRDTVGLIANKNQRTFYTILYSFFAVLMVGSPIAAYVLNTWIVPKNNAIYWVEFAGIWSFASYWIVKGIEMSGCHTEELATKGIKYKPAQTKIGSRVASLTSLNSLLTPQASSEAVPATEADMPAYSK